MRVAYIARCARCTAHRTKSVSTATSCILAWHEAKIPLRINWCAPESLYMYFIITRHLRRLSFPHSYMLLTCTARPLHRLFSLLSCSQIQKTAVRIAEIDLKSSNSIKKRIMLISLLPQYTHHRCVFRRHFKSFSLSLSPFLMYSTIKTRQNVVSS